MMRWNNDIIWYCNNGNMKMICAGTNVTRWTTDIRLSGARVDNAEKRARPVWVSGSQTLLFAKCRRYRKNIRRTPKNITHKKLT